MKTNCIRCNAAILQQTFNRNHGLCATCARHLGEYKDFLNIYYTPGCPRCDGSGQNSIQLISSCSKSWQYSSDARRRYHYALSAKYNTFITIDEQFYAGTLYRTICCNAAFWLPQGSETLLYLDSPRLEWLFRWFLTRTVLPLRLRIQTLSIVATLVCDSNNALSSLDIPCQIKTNEGEVFDPVLLKITDSVPAHLDPSQYICINKVKHILPSPYALPNHIRRYGASINDVMLLRSCKTPDDIMFVVSSNEHFFDYDNINIAVLKGEDMSLVKVKGQMKQHLVNNALWCVGDSYDTLSLRYIYLQPSRLDRLQLNRAK